MSTKKNKQSKPTQKVSASKKAEQQEEARRRAAESLRKQKRAENLKRAGVIAVCIVLVLALCIPTVALSFLSQ